MITLALPAYMLEDFYAGFDTRFNTVDGTETRMVGGHVLLPGVEMHYLAPDSREPSHSLAVRRHDDVSFSMIEQRVLQRVGHSRGATLFRGFHEAQLGIGIKPEDPNSLVPVALRFGCMIDTRDSRDFDSNDPRDMSFLMSALRAMSLIMNER